MASKGLKELKNLSKDELKVRVRDTEAKIFDLRMQLRTGQLENTSSIWANRKVLARAKTLLAQKDQAQS